MTQKSWILLKRSPGKRKFAFQGNRAFYKAIIIKTEQMRHTDPWERTERPKADPRILETLVHNRGDM